MPRRVTIGVTPCSRMDDYLASLRAAGAEPRLLEVTQSPRELIAQLDGVLLTGGGDIDPVLYGEPRHPTAEDAEPGRDEFEIDLARRAMNHDVPLLAICRGAQVLNVAAGGTLIQDIPSQLATGLVHSIDLPKNAIAHDVAVAPGSQLAQALGGDAAPLTWAVNSRHHQAIGRPGDALSVTATSSDGVVEAIERPDAAFCVGVQWHPENFWQTGEFRPLFITFVKAASDRAAGR